MFFPGHYFSFWKSLWEFVDTHVMRESIQEWSEVVFWNNRAHLGRYFHFAELFFNTRGAFRTQWSIYDRVFLAKIVNN